MKKRYLALLCLVALVLSVFALSIKAEAATNYLVGYAIKDINPWIDPNDHSKGLIQGLNLGGQGSKDSIRFPSYVHDDDGDGNVTYNYTSADSNVMTVKSWSPDEDGGDGLHATCIAVTDSKGTTVLFISVDALAAYDVWLSDVRKSIEERLGADVIRQENIIMSGSHTHASLKFNSATQLTNPDATYRNYYDRVITLITDAAEEAMNDRASATMHKATVDASTVTGYQMNFQRHWEVNAYDAYDYTEGSSQKITFAKPHDVDYVSGSNFARLNDLRNYIGRKEGISPIPVPSGGKGVIFDAGDPTGHDGYEETDLVTTDDKMYLIQFKFSDSSKQPIVMVNWRAHTTEAGGDFVKTIKDSAGNIIKYECELSSDYVGPLRALMKANGYRMSFFLGGSGNLVINKFNSNSADVTLWRETIKRNASTGVAQESDCAAYGRLLWKVAQSGLNSADMKTVQTPGDIMTVSSRLTYNRQVDSEGLRDALAAVKAEYPDTFNTNWEHYPYYYTSPKDGKLYIINSYFHASSINSRLSNTAESTTSVTLSTVTLGKTAAFAVVPFEIADRYNMDNPFKTNDWDTLATKGFGTPFVLSCSNGGKGYIPHSMEYIYNTDEYYQKTGSNKNASTYFGPGSYEANTTPTARGTGEQMVALLGVMLDSVGKNARTAWCEACQETVTWQPFYNHTTSPQFDGHYYLIENIENAPKITVLQNRSVCLDLNGKTYSAKGMAFHTYSNGPVLNIFDSSTAKTGKVIGHSRVGYSTADSTQYRGGTLVASSGSTINIYGGTYSFEKLNDAEAVPVSQGGVALALGTINMYGGKIIGADLEVTDWVNASDQLPSDNGYGAAVYVANNATFNMSGGTVTAGTVSAEGQGRCVTVTGANGKVILSGDATIDEVMLLNITNRTQLNVLGEWTGSAAVALAQKIAYAGTNLNGMGAHVDGVMYANAMPYVTYTETDPNTPQSTGWVLFPDDVPDEKFGNQTLLRLRKPNTAVCAACGEVDTWISVYNNTRIPSDASGHYFLAEDISAENGTKIVAQKDQKICLNLNGKTYEVNGTAIHPFQYGTINVMDLTTKKLGQVISHPGTQTSGGVMMLSMNSSVNIYAGTYSYVPTESAPAGVVSGGVAYIYSNATLNVYGGTLQGTALVDPGNTGVSAAGTGGTVTVLHGGKLNVAGGKLTSGTSVHGKGDCVYLAATGSRLELSGDGTIEEVFANWSSVDMITVNGAYTGQTELYFNPAHVTLSNGLDIGNSADASFNVANLWVANSNDYSIKVSGTDLVLSTDKKAAIYTSETDPSPMTYGSLEDALSVYEGGVIRLLDNVSGDLTVDKDVILDLNGKSINGTVTVAEGKTLYGADLSTDDYDIEDGIYGKIKAVSGNVVGLSARVDGTKDYLKITESDGTSFHRVNLTLTYITLSPESASVKYKSEFEGDRLVAENVKQFGIAFNLTEAPNADNLTPGTYSMFTGFQAGAGKNGTSSGTSVVNIMKDDKTEYENGLNAKRAIYGSAYVLTGDGEYLFGQVESRSFRDVVTETDGIWDTLNADQKTAVVELYKRFENNMMYWELKNIAAAAK